MREAAARRVGLPRATSRTGGRSAARLAWTLWALCAVLISSSLFLDGLTPDFLVPPERPGMVLASATALLSLACPTVGALIVSRLQVNPIGWIFCGVGLLYGARRLAAAYADQALLARPWLPGGDLAAWASTVIGFPVLMASGVLLALLFPDGRPPSRRWRLVCWAAILGAAMVCLADALRFGPLPAYYYVVNPFGLAGEAGALPGRRILDASSLAGGTLLSAACAASAVSLALRLRVARGDERQQLGWFAYAAVPALLGATVMLLDRAVQRFMLLFLDTPFRPVLQAAGELGVFVKEDRALGPLAELRLETTFELLAVLSLLAVPVLTGVAVLRHRLYDIDLVINSTLVYGAMTAAVVGLYVSLVAGFGALFQVGSNGNLAVALVATGLISVLFQPLRARLQRGVDRLMYGERRDPYEALSRLGRRLEAALAPEAVLPAIVETVARAMGIPHAEISLKKGARFETAAVYGSPAGEPTVLPLAHGEEQIGRLILSPPPNEPFSPADHRLLGDLARQAEAAVHAVRLTADLKRSRERLVTTREEERRRLRRDLHDGLGPTLAGLTFGLEAARRLVEVNPTSATRLLASLEGQTQEAVVNVRRLVYGLRPPALDDLGLVPAIRQQTEAYGFTDRSGEAPDAATVFSVEVSGELPILPAAVEVAAYRIAQEAITNVVRHAGARSCRVKLSAQEDGAFELEVSDDGRGIAGERGPGVGLSSMRERAEELGGRCEIHPNPRGGTRVLTTLPLATSGKDTKSTEKEPKPGV